MYKPSRRGNLTDMGLLVMFSAFPASASASAKSEGLVAELWCSQRETEVSTELGTDIWV